jgi:D-glycero-alpha-D-manno-heptose-7-phosphate kinase
VLDDMGTRLVETAMRCACGSRFTGAGGGGCLWALGRAEDIQRLRPAWEEVLSDRAEACLLPVGIDAEGLSIAVKKPS